jgi:hypothetical protein
MTASLVPDEQSITTAKEVGARPVPDASVALADFLAHSGLTNNALENALHLQFPGLSRYEVYKAITLAWTLLTFDFWIAGVERLGLERGQ